MPAGIQEGANPEYQGSVGKGAAPGATHCLNNHGRTRESHLIREALFQDYGTKKKHYC